MRTVHLETSRFRGVEPREARAAELQDIGADVAGDRVLRCATDSRGWRTCKRAECPRCAQRRAQRNAERLAEMVVRLDAPLVALVTLTSRGLGDLAHTLTTLRGTFGRLRRRAWFVRTVAGGAGAIEPHLAASGERWEAHVHMAMEAAPAFDVAVAAREWARLTDGRGTFGVHPTRPVLDDAAAFAGYATKAADWCPDPGTFPLPTLHVLFAATKGRRPILAWGTALARRGRS